MGRARRRAQGFGPEAAAATAAKGPASFRLLPTPPLRNGRECPPS